MVFKIVLIYAALISLIGVSMTVYDKIAAKLLPKNRTPEKSLMIVGALGGAFAMLLTMLVIRHKTQHPKFMIGLPAFVFVHAAAVLAVYLLFLA